MSVRRLAPPELQPKDFAFSKDNLAWAKDQVKKYPEGRQASAIIPLMWRAQEQAGGWLPEAAIRYVADFLGMAHIRGLEVATFYTMFNLSPVGKFHVQLCGTTPCRLRGADELEKVCRKRIGEQGDVTKDGKFSWVEVECLGACVNAPMVQIGSDFYEDLTAETFGKVLDGMAAGKKVKPGPQIDRQLSAPVGGQTTLTDLYSAADLTTAAAGLNDARRQGPHLQESLRPERLGPERRACARRLGRHQGDPGERPRRDRQRGEGLRPARARRRRLPDRLEMVVHAEEVGRPPALSRGQCRRVRTRHLQGPRGHAARSAFADRGLPDRRLRHGRQCRLHLYPRRIH